MTVATTIAALQTAHLAISGISAAPTAWPSNADQPKRPFVLVKAAEATWSVQAVNTTLQRQERVYECRCYIQPVAQGVTGPDEGYQKCVTLLDLFGNAYLDDISLGGDVDHISAISDTGALGGNFELDWADVAWWGFIFRVTVVEKST